MEGTALSRFALKDQPTQEMREYRPQLVFTYFEAYPLDAIIVVALGLTATIAIIFLAYKFSKTHTRKAHYRKMRAPSKLASKRGCAILYIITPPNGGGSRWISHHLSFRNESLYEMMRTAETIVCVY